MNCGQLSSLVWEMKSEFYFHPVIGYLRIILKQFSSTLESTSTSGLHKTHIHTQGEIRVWNMWKNCKNTVIWPFPDQLIFRIYHFEVNMMTHLNFCEPTENSFSITLKNLIEILNSMIRWLWVGFSRSPPQNFPFLVALRVYFKNFHMLSQTHITDFLLNCNFQGVLCYLTSPKKFMEVT